MKQFIKRISASVLIAIMLVCMVGCGAKNPTPDTNVSEQVTTDQVVLEQAEAEQQTEEILPSIPKYIFLFIGDGMSYPQIQSAAYYAGTMNSNGGVETSKLSFMEYPVAGAAQTYDSTSFCPDSASTATSIATGYKTYSGTINMDTTMTTEFETIAEKLKKQMNYKIGILSTVNLNHATPAAFYAHQESRNSYYEIAEEMIASEFDYFAGGALKKPTGNNKDKQEIGRAHV